MANDLLEIGSSALGALVVGVTLAITASVGSRAAKRAEAKERTRLQQLVLPSRRFRSDPQGRKYPIQPQKWDELLQFPGKPEGAEHRQEDQSVQEEDGDRAEESGTLFDETQPESAPQGKENDDFILLLIDYYAHGLTQARRNSLASLISAIVGISIVIAGAVLALISAYSGAGVTAAVVVSLSGAITNAIGILFHSQANRALGHMESQTQNLREDMRTDREVRKAIELIGEVGDVHLRDRLRSAIVLQLAKADLPADSIYSGTPNGSNLAGSGNFG